jgi:hypothetical protein
MSTVERRSAGGSDAYATRSRQVEIQESGWLTFAGLTVEFIGLWNVVEGVIALFRSTAFTGTPVFGTIAVWGGIWIAIGVLQLAAGVGIMAGRSWARWFGIVMALVGAIAGMVSIAAYPFWALFVIALDVVILYALTAHWPGFKPAYD